MLLKFQPRQTTVVNDVTVTIDVDSDVTTAVDSDLATAIVNLRRHNGCSE